MLRILVLGCSGLIGYNLCRWWGVRSDVEVHGVCRRLDEASKYLKTIGVNVLCVGSVHELRHKQIENYDYVVNCIGITKHDRRSGQLDDLYNANVGIPVCLSQVCESLNTTFVQISTDCVFDGLVGSYTTYDAPNATDDYGKSKAFAERLLVKDSLVVRTSTVGFHPTRREGLFDWFANTSSQDVKGFQGAIYSGLPTTEFADRLLAFLTANEVKRGLFNLSGPKITKYELLRLLNDFGNFGKQINIDTEVKIDRSLVCSVELRSNVSRNWAEMVERECVLNGYV